MGILQIVFITTGSLNGSEQNLNKPLQLFVKTKIRIVRTVLIMVFLCENGFHLLPEKHNSY
jgi:hypothetical protein